MSRWALSHTWPSQVKYRDGSPLEETSQVVEVVEVIEIMAVMEVVEVMEVMEVI